MPDFMQDAYCDPLYLHGHTAAVSAFPAGTIGTYYPDGIVLAIPARPLFQSAIPANHTDTCDICGASLFGSPCTYCDSAERFSCF